MADRSKWISEEEVAALQDRVLTINNKFDSWMQGKLSTPLTPQERAEFTSRNRARLQEIADMLGDFLGIDVEITRYD